MKKVGVLLSMLLLFDGCAKKAREREKLGPESTPESVTLAEITGFEKVDVSKLGKPDYKIGQSAIGANLIPEVDMFNFGWDSINYRVCKAGTSDCQEGENPSHRFFLALDKGDYDLYLKLCVGADRSVTGKKECSQDWSKKASFSQPENPDKALDVFLAFQQAIYDEYYRMAEVFHDALVSLEGEVSQCSEFDGDRLDSIRNMSRLGPGGIRDSFLQDVQFYSEEEYGVVGALVAGGIVVGALLAWWRPKAAETRANEVPDADRARVAVLGEQLQQPRNPSAAPPPPPPSHTGAGKSFTPVTPDVLKLRKAGLVHPEGLETPSTRTLAMEAAPGLPAGKVEEVTERFVRGEGAEARLIEVKTRKFVLSKEAYEAIKRQKAADPNFDRVTPGVEQRLRQANVAEAGRAKMVRGRERQLEVVDTPEARALRRRKLQVNNPEAFRTYQQYAEAVVAKQKKLAPAPEPTRTSTSPSKAKWKAGVAIGGGTLIAAGLTAAAIAVAGESGAFLASSCEADAYSGFNKKMVDIRALIAALNDDYRTNMPYLYYASGYEATGEGT